MPLPISNFYNDKTIQRSFNFFVSIIGTDRKNFHLPDGEQMPRVKSYHALSISLPTYEFKKEIQYHGPFPKSFPIFDMDGFELKIEFEEDQMGTIGKFVDWMQKRILLRDGTGRYVPPGRNKISMIQVTIVDPKGVDVANYVFPECYFLNASQPQYDYRSNESIKYEITFGCDLQKAFLEGAEEEKQYLPLTD